MQVRAALMNFRISVQIPHMFRPCANISNSLAGNEVNEPEDFSKKGFDKSQQKQVIRWNHLRVMLHNENYCLSDLSSTQGNRIEKNLRDCKDLLKLFPEKSGDPQMQVRAALMNFRISLQIPHMFRPCANILNSLTGIEVNEPEDFSKKGFNKSQHKQVICWNHFKVMLHFDNNC